MVGIKFLYQLLLYQCSSTTITPLPSVAI
jgi:hypothetical protein